MWRKTEENEFLKKQFFLYFFSKKLNIERCKGDTDREELHEVKDGLTSQPSCKLMRKADEKKSESPFSYHGGTTFSFMPVSQFSLLSFHNSFATASGRTTLPAQKCVHKPESFPKAWCPRVFIQVSLWLIVSAWLIKIIDLS